MREGDRENEGEEGREKLQGHVFLAERDQTRSRVTEGSVKEKGGSSCG